MRSPRSGFELAPKIHLSVPHAAGGLIGTVGDLAAWANAFHHGRVVTPQSYQAMTTRAKLNDGGDAPYGFGLQLEQLRGMKTIGHGGGIFGFVDRVDLHSRKGRVRRRLHQRHPADHAAGNGGVEAGRARRRRPVPDVHQASRPTSKRSSPISASTRSPATTTRAPSSREGGKLFTRRDGPPLEVFAAGGNRFFYDDGMTWFELKKGASGPVMEMHQPVSGKPEIATRAGPVPAAAKPADVPRETLARYVGSYLVGGEKAVISLGEDGLSVKLGAQPSFRLIPRSQTEFEVDKVGARLTFNADAGAPAKSVTLNQGGRSSWRRCGAAGLRLGAYARGS